MSEDVNDEAAAMQDLAEAGREKLATIRDGTCDVLTTATDYIRANPWVAVAGAAVIGGVLAAVSHQKKTRRHGNLDAVREWLEEAYSKLPSQQQVQSIAESSGVPDFLKQLRKKLHLD